MTSANTSKKNKPVIIKKYANRRLYNTGTSIYITLDDLCQMVKDGAEFEVRDAKTGEDLTRQILTQIIFDLESQGKNMLPINFLRNLIGFYDGKMKEFLPHYLEATMETFKKNQEKMHEYAKSSIGFSPFTQFEEIGKQNMAFFQKAFQMFNPFEFGKEEEPAEEQRAKKSAKA